MKTKLLKKIRKRFSWFVSIDRDKFIIFDKKQKNYLQPYGKEYTYNKTLVVMVYRLFGNEKASDMFNEHYRKIELRKKYFYY